MRRLVVILFLLPWFAQAQEDSLVFTFEEYYVLVLDNHPVAKQARLLSDQAAAQLRLARGGFDPKVGFNWERKKFKGTEYYNKVEASLKIPTWLGITPEVGVDQNEGAYLNPEEFISESTDNRQVFAGVSVALGKGLFIDERRATLTQARLFSDLAEAEQVSVLNKLLLAASKEYWNWYNDYYTYEVITQSIALAEDIFNRTKLGFEYGEVAVIDTVQAKTNLLTRKNQLIEARIALRKSALKLSTYLWRSDGMPLELPETAQPQQVPSVGLTESELTSLLSLAQNNHPELLKLRVKGESLGVERRMAVENLKPRLDLKYMMLDQPIGPSGDFTDVSVDENYKLGVHFSIPLLLRKERAKLNQVDLKIENNTLEQNVRERSILNEVNANYFELINTQQLITQQNEMVSNYQLLVDAERFNLANGESDLFKLNGQLDKLLESQFKLIKANAAYQKIYAELLWSAGVENLKLN